MDPGGQTVLSITGNPCNVRRAGFLGGRELSPSQCWIDVTEPWAPPLEGALPPLCKRTQRICWQFSAFIIYDFATKDAAFSAHFCQYLRSSLGWFCFLERLQSVSCCCCCWCVLEQDSMFPESSWDTGVQLTMSVTIAKEKWQTRLK